MDEKIFGLIIMLVSVAMLIVSVMLVWIQISRLEKENRILTEMHEATRGCVVFITKLPSGRYKIVNQPGVVLVQNRENGYVHAIEGELGKPIQGDFVIENPTKQPAVVRFLNDQETTT